MKPTETARRMPAQSQQHSRTEAAKRSTVARKAQRRLKHKAR